MYKKAGRLKVREWPFPLLDGKWFGEGVLMELWGVFSQRLLTPPREEREKGFIKELKNTQVIQ